MILRTIFLSVCLLTTSVIIIHGQGNFGPTTPKIETWTGRWLPERPTKGPPEHLKDPHHGIQMGVPSVYCDDAKTNLTVDWDSSPINYTCFNPTSRIIPNLDIPPRIVKENIPVNYVAQHFCMNMPLTYTSDFPTFGPHRPLWAVWGEYRFLPKQRWLHNLEHGGLVMLYHPCADAGQLQLLKRLVRQCLRRYVISPDNLLDKERPFALLTWGWKLTMSTVYPNLVQQFIRKHAIQGPEMKPEDGHYDYLLESKSETVSNFDDDVLCPHSF